MEEGHAPGHPLQQPQRRFRVQRHSVVAQEVPQAAARSMEKAQERGEHICEESTCARSALALAEVQQAARAHAVDEGMCAVEQADSHWT